MPMIVEYKNELKQLKILHATPQEMSGFVWPDDVSYVIISGDFLDELIIPEGVTELYCFNLGLKKLHLPSTAEYVYASNNCLLELDVPPKISFLDVSYNPLYNLRFLDNTVPELLRLKVRDTYISSLRIRISKKAYLNACGCRYLVNFCPETSYAYRSFLEYKLELDEFPIEPEEWVVTPLEESLHTGDHA